MALNAGDTDCTTGLSLRLYTALSAAPGMVSPLNAQAIAAIKGMSHAIAVAVVAEIQANAVVSGTTSQGSGETITGTVG